MARIRKAATALAPLAFRRLPAHAIQTALLFVLVPKQIPKLPFVINRQMIYFVDCEL
jgi:hypothetical protein